MAEYLDRRDPRGQKPLPPQSCSIADDKGCLKSCGHAPDYRCACRAHEDAEQHPDLVDELTMNPGYRLARAYGYELHGGDDIEDGRAPKHKSKIHHTHRWTTWSDGTGTQESCMVCGERK